MAFEPGNRIGDYEVVQVLGAGGMGKVYKVRNVISDRVEAMKVLLPNLEGDPELADRFMREIKVQASLQHPNIAALHTAARIDNQLLMLMEFVEGTSLDKLLKQGPMPVQEAIRVTIATLEALGYAHEQGIIHRDIKPANIMLTPQGHVKLMDFGIARLASDPRVTQTGRTVGSLFYMSPEQINGYKLDGRSDLYSLGISLYEMVTGQRPFQGDSDFSIMAAHLQQMPVPPIQLDPRVPQQLNELILASLAKNPDERFQSAAAFRNALASIAPSIPNQPALAPVSSQTMPLPGPLPGPLPANPGMRTPTPPPQAAPAQQGFSPQGPIVSTAPPPAAVVKQGSARPLYLILGSVATLAVIALGIWLVPRYMGTKAGEPPTGTTTPAGQSYQPPADPNAGSTAGTASTAPDPGASGSTATPGATPGSGTPGSGPVGSGTLGSGPVGSVMTNPATGSAGTVATPPSGGIATPSLGNRSVPPITATGRLSTGVPATNQAAAAATQQVQQQVQVPAQPPAQQTAVQTPPPAQQPPAGPSAATVAQLNELRERYNQMAIRMGGLNDSLQRLEAQQGSMGVGLRGDIREARTRHQYQMREAQQYLQAGNVEGAKTSLDRAERALEIIEKFLNR